MKMPEDEITRLAHIAAHDIAVITIKAFIANTVKSYESDDLEGLYKKTYESIYDFVDKKLS